MQSKRLAPTVLLVSMILVAVSGVAAWIAVGAIANGTVTALERMESALLTARDLADTSASSASELEQVVAVVGDGLASTSEALAATQEVSKSVRGVLGLVDFIGSVDNLKTSLEDAEKSLVFVQGSLNTASSTLEQAGPALHETVVALAAVPDEINAAIEQAAAARAKVNDQVWLWRLAIVAGCLAIVGGLWAVRENARRVDSLMNAVAPSAPPAGATS
jgi:methyl-accepting chemotaxis protein